MRAQGSKSCLFPLRHVNLTAMRISRITFTFTLVALIAWGVWANHCIVSDAFASSGQSSHCHHEDSGHHKTGDHHSGCKDKGCCDPALQSSANNGLGAPTLLVTSPAVPSLAAPQILISSEKIAAPFQATGPPKNFTHLLITLAIAPNAPPASSTYC
jgi:hypothetical protein